MTERPLTVGELMSTVPVTARPGETVADVDFEMRLASVRHFPIVARQNRLVGMVAQRDLLRAMARSKTGAVPMRDAMTTRVVTVHADTLAAEAAELMLAHRLDSLPVVAEDGQLVGLVSESDFVALAGRLLRGPAIEPQPARRAG
jgi:CBS domain-containing membrane protein